MQGGEICRAQVHRLAKEHKPTGGEANEDERRNRREADLHQRISTADSSPARGTTETASTYREAKERPRAAIRPVPVVRSKTMESRVCGHCPRRRAECRRAIEATASPAVADHILSYLRRAQRLWFDGQGLQPRHLSSWDRRQRRTTRLASWVEPLGRHMSGCGARTTAVPHRHYSHA